ncbi:hypothetical protein [Streptomyces sp. HSG2]|uniref:hypothetical protein n=1 Tax=Streptomyces sp. HSG2 TaxID=2797167 RepID=UPI001904E25D|nr:hypothetical protein [Streptomyces sp. HSG2]
MDETQAGSLHPGPVEPVGVTFTGLAANAFAAVTFAGAGAAATYATYGVVSTVVQTAG